MENFYPANTKQKTKTRNEPLMKRKKKEKKAAFEQRTHTHKTVQVLSTRKSQPLPGASSQKQVAAAAAVGMPFNMQTIQVAAA